MNAAIKSVITDTAPANLTEVYSAVNMTRRGTNVTLKNED